MAESSRAMIIVTSPATSAIQKSTVRISHWSGSLNRDNPQHGLIFVLCLIVLYHVQHVFQGGENFCRAGFASLVTVLVLTVIHFNPSRIFFYSRGFQPGVHVPVRVQMPVMCPSHFCRVRFIQNFFESSQSHENCRVTSSHWFANSSQCRVTRNFTFFLHFFCLKWRPTCHKMATEKFENGVQHAMKWRPIS